MVMRRMMRVVLKFFVLASFLSLISCTEKSIVTESTIVLTTTPSQMITPSSVETVTPLIPTVKLTSSPTEVSFHILDGKLLFEANNKKNGLMYSAIKIYDIQSGETIQIIEDGQEVSGQPVHLIHPSMTWSPNGHWVAFVGHDIRANQWIYGYQDIFVAKADGTDIHRLTYSPQYDKHYLSWSPDEQNILVALGKNGNSDLYIISAKNGEMVKRLTSSGKVFIATWSPDGSSIAYAENLNLYIMDLGAMTPRLVSSLLENSEFWWRGISWSPNGKKLAFSSGGDNAQCSDIYVYDLITNELVNLTSTNYDESSPSWSFDGKYLAFSRASYACSEAVDDWNIIVTNLMGEEQEIISNASSLTSVAWNFVPNLEIGKKYTVTELGANLNLRTEPSLSSKIIKKLLAGEVITVLDGFVDADDYYWWKIKTQDGIEGWAVEVANWCMPLNPNRQYIGVSIFDEITDSTSYRFLSYEMRNLNGIDFIKRPLQ